MTKFQPCTQNAEIQVMAGKQRAVASQIDGDNLDLSHAFFKKLQMEPSVNKKGEQRWKKFYVDNDGQRRVKFVKKCPNALFQTLETRGVNREIAQSAFRGQKKKALRSTEEKKKQAAERGDGCLGIIEANGEKMSFSITHLYRAWKMLENYTANVKDVFGDWSAVDEVRTWNGVSNRGAKDFVVENGGMALLENLTSTDYAVDIDVTGLLQSCTNPIEKMAVCLALLSVGTGSHNASRPNIRRAAVSLVESAYENKLCDDLKTPVLKSALSLCLGCMGYLKCWSLVETNATVRETLEKQFKDDLGSFAKELYNPFNNGDIMQMRMAVKVPTKTRSRK